MARKPDPKLLALKETGTLNPQAQEVQDAAFLGDSSRARLPT